MDPVPIKRVRNPEAIIQAAIVNFLILRGWHVMVTHGNASQKGFPDLYCVHSDLGQRWIEVKNPEQYSFTEAQLIHFPKITSCGVGIWIMTAATKTEYAELFKHHRTGNWEIYLRKLMLLGERNSAKH